MTNRRIQINAAAVILLGSLAFMGPLSGAAVVGGGEVDCGEYQCADLETMQCDPDEADAFCENIGCGSIHNTCDAAEEHDCDDEMYNSAVRCIKD